MDLTDSLEIGMSSSAISSGNGKTVEDKNQEEREMEKKFTGFAVPLYLQRYIAVKEILIKHNITKCIDFGSSECRVIDQYSQMEKLSRLAFVDIDRTALISNLHRLTPRLMHSTRPIQLTVEVYEGDVTKYDHRMKAFEAATLIEVIEHLIPEDLEMCCNMVFGQLHPKLVVLTTPNSEFNVVFDMAEGKLRHWDHKFEWTREEFQSWCNNIAEMYGYNVEYSGVGETDKIPNLGYCSQIATFNRLQDISYDPIKKEDTYKFITKIQYPYMSDERKKSYLLDSVNFYLNKYAYDWFKSNEEAEEEEEEEEEKEEESKREKSSIVNVPLTDLMLYSGIWENCSDINSLRKSLICAGYNLTSDGHSVLVERKTNKQFDEESDDDNLLFDENEFGGSQFSDAEDDCSQNVLTKDYTVPCFEEHWN